MRWLRWTGVAAVILVAAVAGCIFVPGVFFVGVSPGEGVVVNTETERPISGALVILECRRALLHGSRVVKYVARETDEAGRYHFGFFDVARCNFAHVYPFAHGYVEVIDGHHSYEPIPHRLYLTPIADVRMRRLRADHRMLSGTYSAPFHEYLSVYDGFQKAKRIALTREEWDFVTQAYCRRLIDLYARLTPEEREKTKRFSAWEGGRVDHEGKVMPWCREGE